MNAINIQSRNLRKLFEEVKTIASQKTTLEGDYAGEVTPHDNLFSSTQQRFSKVIAQINFLNLVVKLNIKEIGLDKLIVETFNDRYFLLFL